MDYLIVTGGIISNIIVADDEFAASVGALPSYLGAAIGKTYNPPTIEKLQVSLLHQESALADSEALNIDHEYRLTLLELGVTTDVV